MFQPKGNNKFEISVQVAEVESFQGSAEMSLRSACLGWGWGFGRGTDLLGI